MQLSSAATNIHLKYISNDDLLFRTKNLVQTERKIMHLVLAHILEIMSRKLYAELGFDSMYTMMTKKYGYSEASAIRRIDAAKLLRSVPEVAERLKSGTLNLSQACLLQKCLESDAKKGETTSVAKTQEILEKLEACNGFETRQVLAKEFDMPLKIQDIVRPQKDESVRLEITFTKEQFEELKQAKSFLSHIAHTGSWAEVISVLASKLNQSKSGKPSKEKLGSTADFTADSKNSKSIGHPLLNLDSQASIARPKPISIYLKRELFEKAQGSCQYTTPSGLRCGSRFQIQIDHITPHAWGGANKVDNLRLLCRTHNLLMAGQMHLL